MADALRATQDKWEWLLSEEHRDKIGQSIWVWFWCLFNVTSEENGVGVVCDNSPLKYEMIADELGLSVRTVGRQVATLAGHGYLRVDRTRWGFRLAMSLDPAIKLEAQKKPEGPKRERSKLSLGLRYEVMKRDGFKCVFCGATKDTDRLVIDHVFPVSKGGKTEMRNLQTLCWTCNTGKGDKTE